jgi:AcrR family transcriptional regulator
MTYGHIFRGELRSMALADRPFARKQRPRSARPGRRERRAAETREKLFRCALGLFAERGFASVTVEDITEGADVGKGTFFNYFPSKEHLMVAFGDMQLGKLASLAGEVRSGRRGVAEGLRALPRIMAEEPGRSPRLISSMFAAFHANEQVRGIFVEKLARGRAILRGIFALGQKRGEIRHDAHPALLARAFQQSFFGTLVMWAIDPAFPLDKRLAATLDLVFHGLAPRSLKRK